MTFEDLKLEEISDGFQVHYRGRSLYSPTGPKQGALRRARAAELPAETLFLVPSPLLGYGIAELLRRLPETSHLFCLELDPALGELSASLPRDLDAEPRVSFFLAGFAEAKSTTWRTVAEKLIDRGYRRVRTIVLNGGTALNRQAYRGVEEELSQAIQQTWQNKMTAIRLGRIWGRNFLINLGRTGFYPDASALREQRPVVVAGPSESIEECIPHLKAIRRQVGLMALDTCLPILLQHGLAPDYVVSVDSQRANALDFVGAGSAAFRLLAETTVHPSIPRLRNNRNVYWFSSKGFDTQLVRDSADAGLLPLSLPPVGSVAVAAILLALRMTHRSVFLCGVDLAYIPGKPYASGAPLHIEELSSTNRLSPERMLGLSFKRPRTMVPGRTGAAVPTDLVLLSYRHQLYTLLKGTTRVAVVGDKGLDLGVAHLSPRDFENRITEKDESMGGGAGAADGATEGSGSSEPAGRGLRLSGFLSERLSALRDAKQEANPASGAVQAWDHAWFDFPEAQTHREPGPTFAQRLSLRLRRYERILEELVGKNATLREP